MKDHQNSTGSNCAAIWFFSLNFLGTPLSILIEFIQMQVPNDFPGIKRSPFQWDIWVQS